ncbi:hypothetical protein J2X31_001363 [Flavobacterium arsenatis]|uniref:Hydrolase n=1 Tax=Flavobacterium arsenatis TaxID=1484332 RepID=A0ABU1TN08_9FLAO|nr:hypothetical protein [Flavobacterium arsenatis]MDR6967352.1 hypothetical protein [Flavobacterium arsenatis]
MKKSILLYLFILSLLFNVFTYMYYSKQVNFEKDSYKKLDTKLRDSLNLVVNQLDDANYFALETNQNAQEYFADDATGEFINHEKLIPFVKDKLMEFNDLPNGNPYVGFEKMSAQKFIINKAKVLNHRWIIADFSDGSLWGEVIIKYFINEDKTVSFEVAETVLHHKQ